MKKTNNPFKILLVVLAVSVGATAIVALLEYTFGVADLFIASVCSIPFWLVLCVVTSKDNIEARKQKQWRKDYDLDYREVMRKTN
jgi:hypothetical protein